jgi:YggT family protein
VTAIWQLLYLVVFCFWLLLLSRLVMEYVMMFARSWRPGRAVAVGLEVVYSATDPPLRALRRIIPPLRLGGMSLDLGFLVLAVIVYILLRVLQGLATS